MTIGFVEMKKEMNYGKTIIDFPDQIDPVKLIDEKMRTCPFCNRVVSDDSTPWSKEYKSDYVRTSDCIYLDAKGKEHRFRKKLNKYRWFKYIVRCGKCYTKWKTDYFPADYQMFEIKVKEDTNNG